MGLMVHSLEEIPENVKRDYYLYLLDYGWDEPLSNVLKNNFEKIASYASKSNSVFIKGTIGSHVDSEILSWHHINGEPGEEILPALLITTMNPHYFRALEYARAEEINSKIILIPLRKCCSTSSDIIELIERIFQDINKKVELNNFSIYKRMHKSIGKRIVDGVILHPNFYGLGFNFEQFLKK